MLRLSDARNFGRTLAGLAMIGAPLVFIPADALAPGGDDAAEQLADIASAKAASATSLILLLVAAILMLVAALGVIHLFRGPRVTLGQLGGGLIALATLAMIAFYGLGGLQYVMATEAGLDRGQMAVLLDEAESAPVFIPIVVMFLAGAVIGSVLVAVANWRRPIAPRWAGPALVASAVATVAGESVAVNIVSDVLMLAGLGALGLAALRMSDEEWDAPGRSSPRADGRRMPVAA